MAGCERRFIVTAHFHQLLFGAVDREPLLIEQDFVLLIILQHLFFGTDAEPLLSVLV